MSSDAGSSPSVATPSPGATKDVAAGGAAEIERLQSKFLDAVLYIPGHTLYAFQAPRAALRKVYNDWVEGGLTEYREGRDGHGALQLLSTFAAVEGASLAGTVRFTEAVWAPLMIYWILFIATMVGIREILKLADESDLHRHFYDKGTIVFGRWALCFTLVLAILVTILVLIGQLSVKRERFERSSIEFTKLMALSEFVGRPYSVNGRSFTPEQRAASADLFRWLEHRRFPPRKGDAAKGTIHVAHSTDVFDADYRDIEGELDILGAQVSDSLVFLFRDDGLSDSTDSQPVLRQLSFRLGKGDFPTDNLVISKPNKGERILMIAYLPSGVDPQQVRIAIKVR